MPAETVLALALVGFIWLVATAMIVLPVRRAFAHGARWLGFGLIAAGVAWHAAWVLKMPGFKSADTGVWAFAYLLLSAAVPLVLWRGMRVIWSARD